MSELLQNPRQKKSAHRTRGRSFNGSSAYFIHFMKSSHLDSEAHSRLS